MFINDAFFLSSAFLLDGTAAFLVSGFDQSICLLLDFFSREHLSVFFAGRAVVGEVSWRASGVMTLKIVRKS